MSLLTKHPTGVLDGIKVSGFDQWKFANPSVVLIAGR
jgi:hypothetical protein